jgi:hypothetical protein
MSQPDFDRALERMATDPAFATTVRANPASALAGYDLSEAERQNLALMETAGPATNSVPAAATLATRRSKSSMLGIGAVAGVAAVGAAGFGVIHYVVQPSSGTPHYMSLEGGSEGGVNTVAQGANDGSSVTFTINRPVDHLSAEILQDSQRGVIVNTVTLRYLSGGQDVKHVTLSHVIFSSVQVSATGSGDGTQSEVVKLVAQSEQVTYP